MSGAVFFLYLQRTLLFCVRPCKSLFLVNLKRLDIGPNAFMVCMEKPSNPDQKRSSWHEKQPNWNTEHNRNKL